jgi:hypothetical protein
LNRALFGPWASGLKHQSDNIYLVDVATHRRTAIGFPAACIRVMKDCAAGCLRSRSALAERHTGGRPLEID